MTSEDLRSELEKAPFIPLRLHLVSGKTLDVRTSGAAHMLKNTVMVFQEPQDGQRKSELYDVIALRNIERVEQLPEPDAA